MTNISVVHKELGVKNLIEFIELVKSKPGRIDSAFSGSGYA